MALNKRPRGLEPQDGKLCSCRNRIYTIYKDNRKLTKELREELEQVRLDDGEQYRYLLQELLAWTSYHNDETSFVTLLGMARQWQDEKPDERSFGILRRMLPVWMQDPNNPCGQNGGSGRYIYDYSHDLLITNNPIYLKKLMDTLGLKMQCRQELWTYQMPYFCDDKNRLCTDLPDPLILILSGQTALVYQLWDKGTYGNGAVSGGQGCGVLVTKHHKWRCQSVLTAALYTDRSELLDFVLTNFPALEYRREMLPALHYARDETVRQFLSIHPEILHSITWRELVRFPHPELLNAFLRHSRTVPKGTKLTAEAVVQSNELLRAPKKILYRRTYRTLCAYVQDEQTRMINVREFLRCFQIAESDLFSIHQPDREDYKFLLEQLPPGSDITPLLRPAQNQKKILDGLLSMYEWDPSPAEAREFSYRVDIYRLGASCFRSMNRADYAAFMNTFSPLHTEARADSLTKYLITKGRGDAALVKLAIQKGYVNETNAPFIRPSHRTSWEISLLLLPFSKDRPLEGKYDWSEERQADVQTDRI